jgi:hypothetical protein
MCQGDAAGALDPGLDKTEAADIVYAVLSPDVHRILTVERRWPADRYERWIARSLLTEGQHQPADPASKPSKQQAEFRLAERLYARQACETGS